MLENNPDPNELSRIELLTLAHSLQISDADVMTRAELRAAIEKARKPEPKAPEQPVTWVSVARRLLASIVEQGLNLPDAAALIRGDTKLSTPPKAPPPVATVTLARIYAAQGHLERAIRTVDEVLASDPDHHPAQHLRNQLQARLEEQRRAREAEATSSPPPAPAATASDEPTALAEPVDSLPPETLSEPSALAVQTEAPPAGDLEPSEPSPVSNGIAHFTAEPGAAAPHSEPRPGAAAPERAPAPEADAPEAEAPAPPLLSAPTAATPELVVHPPAEVPIHVALADAPTDVPSAHAGAVAILTHDGPAPEPQSPLPTPPPRAPGLVVIETGAPTAYVYWELAIASEPELNQAPCWISVVTHSPTKYGSERHERQIPVFRSAGALRLEGVPTQAVLRAKLSREQASQAPPLAVASTVRASSLALADLEPRFTPHPRANPRPLARRATAHLEAASPVHW